MAIRTGASTARASSTAANSAAGNASDTTDGPLSALALRRRSCDPGFSLRPGFSKLELAICELIGTAVSRMSTMRMASLPLAPVAVALDGQELGDGTVARTCHEIQARYYRPPPDAMHPPQQLNKIARR